MPLVFGHPLALSVEPHATAVLLLALGVLVAVSVLFSRAVDRLGVPVVLLFLVLGVIGGVEGIGHVAFTDYRLAVRLGTVALVLILFDGGLNTTAAAVRQALYPATMLATVGVLLTAALTAGFARLLGLRWTEAALLGAVVSSTDAAAVLAVLRGGKLQLKARVGGLLEMESCINDPMAVILTTSIIQATTAHERIGWKLAVEVPLQLAIGAGVGLAVGYLGRLVLRRVRLTTAGLYPALTVSFAFLSFGAATLTRGSGFLAVYVTALLLGNFARLPYRSGMTRIHDALAWLAQIAMFLMLGLLVYPSHLMSLEVAGVGLAIGLFLAAVARPLATIACLWPFRYSHTELGYIGWCGLRGAVPIILATFPVLAGVSRSDHIFNLVFFIVIVSSLIPGATIRSVTRRLGLVTPGKPAPMAVLEINSPRHLGGMLTSYFIDETLAVCGATLAEIEFPPGSGVVLIVRGEELIAARGKTKIEAGDHAYVFYQPQDRPFVELLFGRPEEG